MFKKLLLAGALCCACAFAQNMPSALSQSTLTANVLAAGGGPVSISAPFPFIPSAPLNQGVIYMDSEAMLVLSANLSLNQLTVLRGYLATTAAAHNAGALAFSGQPFQFISVDKSGACDPNSPQFLNVADQTYFTCINGAWSAAGTTNGGGGGSGTVTGITASSPLTGGTIHTSGSIGCPTASGSQAGCLSAADWTTFNGKQAAGSFLTAPGTNNVIVKYTSATSTLPALFADFAALITGTASSSTYLNGLGAWTIPPGSGGFYQTFQANGTPSSQQATFNAVAGTNMTITPTTVGSVTTFTFASSGGGSSPLTTKGDVYGFSTVAARVPVGTDAFVLTADSTQALGVKWAAVGSASNSWTSGSGVPTANCTPGTGNYLYFDTALTNPGPPQYYCSATNVWTQTVNLGGTGCLAYTAGTLDINTACVPQKAAANTFTANQTEGLGAKWSNTHGTVTQTSGWAALSGGTSGAIATSSIAALGTPTTAGDWVQMANMNCTGILNYSIVAATSVTITDTVSESCSVHWEIKHDQ